MFSLYLYTGCLYYCELLNLFLFKLIIVNTLVCFICILVYFWILFFLNISLWLFWSIKTQGLLLDNIHRLKQYSSNNIFFVWRSIALVAVAYSCRLLGAVYLVEFFLRWNAYKRYDYWWIVLRLQTWINRVKVQKR